MQKETTRRLGDLKPELRIKKDRLIVSELYGPVPQGEGKNLGVLTYFLRLGFCNLHCVWCDSKFTWDSVNYDLQKELTSHTIGEVAWDLKERSNRTGIKHLVITGGEPLLQQSALVTLCNLLHEDGWYIEVETAGAVTLLYRFADLYTVSLKLENSGNSIEKRFKENAIISLRQTEQCVWKFVVTSDSDLEEIDFLVENFNLKPVFIMGEGITVDDTIKHLRDIAPKALNRGYNLTTRLQVLLHGNKRGT